VSGTDSLFEVHAAVRSRFAISTMFMGMRTRRTSPERRSRASTKTRSCPTINGSDTTSNTSPQSAGTARRLIADELILSFVPNGEQWIWRSMTRMKLQLTRDRVRLQNQIECLLEEMRIKLSIVVSNLLGASGLRILHVLANGEADPKKLEQLVGNSGTSARCDL
jgi:hypothetical protein